MKDSLIWAELKDIITKPMVLISISAVMFIPILYAGVFLWSFWDPYGNLDNLPVAVVNKDKGADFEGEPLTLGDELEKELKKSDDFDFHIVSNIEADKGMKKQDYYMKIEIPENFSENATTLLEDEPEKMQLKYIPNQSYNFTSSLIGDTALKEIRTSLQKNVTKTYSETIFEKIKQMGDGLAEASDGARELDEGALKLNEGAGEIKENLAQLADKSLLFSEGITKAGDGSKQLASGAAQLTNGLEQLEEGQNKLIAGGKDVQSGTSNLTGGAVKLQEGLYTIDGKMEELTAGTAEARTGVQLFQEKIPALMKGTSDLAAGAKQLNGGLSQMEQQLIQQINGAMSKQMEQLMPALEQSMTPEQLEALKQQMEQQQQQIAAGIQSTVEELQAGSEKLAAGSNDVNEAISGQLAPNMEKLNSGLSTIQSGQAQLKKGVGNLAAGSDELVTGATKLQQGQTDLVSGMEQLEEKLKEAKNGSAELAGGAQTLTGGFQELGNGSKQLSEGAGKLAAGSTELAEGSSELEKGTKELQEKLGEAAEEASSVKSKDSTNEMMAEPVAIKKEPMNKVPNYGTGLTPYFLSLGLFVGALLFTIVYPFREPAIVPKSGFRWFLGKTAVLILASFIQSAIAVAVMLFALKIDVESEPLFFLTAFITSLTFMALIQMLATILGDPGRFIAILVLILQLATSAGTFPLELIPKALQPFSNFVPMSYSVKAFKAVISSGDFAFMWANLRVLGLFAIPCLLVTSVFFTGLYKRRFAHKIGGNAAEAATEN